MPYGLIAAQVCSVLESFKMRKIQFSPSSAVEIVREQEVKHPYLLNLSTGLGMAENKHIDFSMFMCWQGGRYGVSSPVKLMISWDQLIRAKLQSNYEALWASAVYIITTN